MSSRRPSGGLLGDKRAVWLASAAVAVTLAIDAATRRRYTAELWFGMLAPLVTVVVTWVLTERAYRSGPERVTGMMIGAFAGKLVFFGTYVALAIGVLGLAPVPFAVSFTGSFITLHLIEALWLKRLLA